MNQVPLLPNGGRLEKKFTRERAKAVSAVQAVRKVDGGTCL